MSAIDKLELRVPPVVVMAVAAALMVISNQWLPDLRFILPGQAILAALLAAGGAAIAISGVLAFRRVRTTVNPLAPETTATLVTGGIYRVSRNPMYLGFLLVLCGHAVLLANVAALAVLPLFVGYMNRFQIEPEERTLYSRFGEGFSDYQKQVGRWC